MRVRVRLFAMLRERAGRDSVELALGDDATVADALEALRADPRLDEMLGRLPVRMAVNRDLASLETELTPATSSRSCPRSAEARGAVHARVTGEELSVEALSRAVGRPGAGAIVVFQGTTREIPRLEYEAYEEMATERIAAILDDCVERHDLEAAAAEHRVGAVPLGEPSVIVAVSAAHRDAAFAAAREAIDRIKTEVPIWKCEVTKAASGQRRRWVEGTPE